MSHATNLEIQKFRKLFVIIILYDKYFQIDLVSDILHKVFDEKSNRQFFIKIFFFRTIFDVNTFEQFSVKSLSDIRSENEKPNNNCCSLQFSNRPRKS